MLPSQVEAPDIFNLENPRSIMNLVPGSLKKFFQEHSLTEPELFNKDERDLYKLLRSREETPSPTDNRLRLKFWFEYDRCQEAGSFFNISNVIAGVTTKDYFDRGYLSKPNKVAWLLCPPTNYLVKAEEALEFGLEQLRDLLEQPNMLTSGKVNVRVVELKLKIVQMLDSRVKGAVVQRSVNLNVGATDSVVRKNLLSESMEDLQKQIKTLEARNRAAQNAGLVPIRTQKSVIDVESE